MPRNQEFNFEEIRSGVIQNFKFDTIMKRIFDFCFAVLGLCFVWPVFLGISIVIFLSDGRPIFFKQQRVGLKGKDFSLLKFRSMSLLEGAESGRFDAGDSSRVTPFGMMIRKYKLDELPQLWNVVKGDMSFVGPRPEIRKWVDVYPERWECIFGVRPGITDPASIRFRNEEELLAESSDPEREYRKVILPQKLKLYEDYIASSSVIGDLAIILKTILVVIRN